MYIYIYIFLGGGGNFFDCFIFQNFIIKFDYEKGLNHKPNKTPTNLPEPLKYMYLCMFIEKGIAFKGQLSEKRLQCVYSTLYWLLSKKNYTTMPGLGDERYQLSSYKEISLWSVVSHFKDLKEI